MAASTLSFGMFAARALSSARRRAGLASGFGPPDFTAMAMSLLTRVNSFAILFQRANIVALRVSKMRPMSDALLPRADEVARDLVDAHVLRHLREHDGASSAHLLRVTVHHVEVRADEGREV